jgi:hypothetical protein
MQECTIPVWQFIISLSGLFMLLCEAQLTCRQQQLSLNVAVS